MYEVVSALPSKDSELLHDCTSRVLTPESYGDTCHYCSPAGCVQPHPPLPQASFCLFKELPLGKN